MNFGLDRTTMEQRFDDKVLGAKIKARFIGGHGVSSLNIDVGV